MLRIGLASYSCINNGLDYNISQIERAMQEAAGRADLLCFGEAFLQGFDSLCWDYASDRDVAVTQDSAEIRALAKLTRRYHVDLGLGYLERFDDTLYSSYMILSQGQVLHNYRRVSPGWREVRLTDSHYREGDTSEDFLYRGRQMRVALCGDLWEYPARFRTQGILLWPVYVDYTVNEWVSGEILEYAKQASLAAADTLLINSISDDPDGSHGGALHFREGAVSSSHPFDRQGILYITLG